jgi:hypothetical protein
MIQKTTISLVDELVVPVEVDFSGIMNTCGLTWKLRLPRLVEQRLSRGGT